LKPDYHKRVEEIHQAVDRLRFHAATSARALEYDEDLKQRALEHMDQALEHLVRSYELSKEARRRRKISCDL
jgi:ribosomal 50S subunit-associated protein YjgA (DUF615 family)